MALKTISCAALATLIVAAPTTASAKTTDEGCGYSGTQVFAPWNDDSYYTLIADGGFEAGADGWALDGGAAVVEGNESFQVGGADDHRSLALPAGASATSPTTCVSKGSREFRGFARTDGSRKARLRVEVLSADGTVQESAEMRADDTWAPTPILKVSLSGGSTTAVSLRLTPVGEPADWQVDDVYVDPRLRH